MIMNMVDDDFGWLTSFGADLNDDGSVDLEEYLLHEDEMDRMFGEDDSSAPWDDDDDI